MGDYYDRKGNKLADTMAWGVLHADAKYQVLAQDQVGDLFVSTVWLGLDHSFRGGPPLIFETMVFASEHAGRLGLGSDLFCERYSTEEEAFAGHADVMARIAGGTFTDYMDEPVDTTYVIAEEPTLI